MERIKWDKGELHALRAKFSNLIAPDDVLEHSEARNQQIIEKTLELFDLTNSELYELADLSHMYSQALVNGTLDKFNLKIEEDEMYQLKEHLYYMYLEGFIFCLFVHREQGIY